ncbi:ABC transporter substrate-binding protein [Actinocrispum wychmicini]|uniref:Peptide/nickel transport system substrate-binding protein n=1 Tax=Actinocrispum wychmicini TaxID=1213861 RepID=A0A4R2JUZ2_9PSEU|nr:ABC transporter substrate-binding protein [Actinocrispum wychmicini]TCO61106.1 peptide/nickel transport system substrate-binding protein [Actinocrispum wychmicini]
MAQRRVISGLVAAMLVTAIAAGGCTGGSGSGPLDSQRAGTVVFDMDSGMPESTTQFSPYSRNGNNGLIQSVYEPLFISDVRTGKLQPWLGLSMTSDPTYTDWLLKLHPGVKWSDGQDFTADDVVYTLDAIKAGKLGDSGVAAVSNLAAVSATDPLTVSLKVAHPDPRLDANLFGTAVAGQAVIILPKHIWAQQADPKTFNNFDLGKGWPVGTGPYKLSGVTPNTFTYTRLDNWWGVNAGFMSLPAPTTLKWTALGTESNRAAALANGELDQAEQISTGTFLSLRARDPQIHAWQDTAPYGAPDVCGYSLDFNTTTAPWNDPALRWAVSYAIDRKGLIDTAFQGASKINSSIFSDYPIPNKAIDGLKGQGAALAQQVATFDQRKAAEMFQAAGYQKNGDGIYQKNGTPLSLVVTNFDSAPKNAVTAAVVEQLRRAGIDASQDKKTVSNFVRAELSGDFKANLFFGTCGTVVGILPSLDSLNVSHDAPAGKNVASFYSNPFRWNTENAKKYGGYVDQIAQLSPDDPKVDELFQEAIPYFYQDLPSVPLLYNYQINPVSTKHWTGWPLSDDFYNWGYYLDPSLQLVLHRLKPAH